MQTTQLKSRLFFYLPLLISVVGSVLLLIVTLVLDVKFPFRTQHFSFVKSLLLLLAIGGIYFSNTFIQTWLRKKSFYLLLGYLFLFVALSVIKIINLYELGTLPAFFYTLKLFRLLTISSDFLIIWLLFFISIFGIVNSTFPKISVVKNKLRVFLVGCVSVIFFAHLQVALAQTHQATIQAIQNLDTKFADRFTYRLGGTSYYGWIWPFSQFIISHTDKNAQILVPPMSDTWKMEGNTDYFRWFMYPRKLVHLTPEGKIPAGTTHILITFGECKDNDCGWPFITLPPDQVENYILVDRKTQEQMVITGQGYTPEPTNQRYGIITLK